MVLWLPFLCILLFNPNVACATPFKTTIPFVVDPQYEIQILVPGSHFHGIHGLTFDSQDNLYAGSVVGRAIYYVNTNTGDVKEFIGPPNGMADDVEFGPDGRIYYTSFLEGKLRCKGADGKVTVLAEGLPGINSLAFNNEGRLFATQVFMGDVGALRRQRQKRGRAVVGRQHHVRAEPRLLLLFGETLLREDMAPRDLGGIVSGHQTCGPPDPLDPSFSNGRRV